MHAKQIDTQTPAASRRFRALPKALAASALLLALGGCATGMGGLGGAYPGGYGQGQSYPDQYRGQYGSQRLLGTVQGVDPRYGRIVLSTEGRGGYGGGQVEVMYDRNTQLVYQGRVLPVDGLERGDRISVDTVRSGNRLVARRIEVVHNVRDSRGGSYYGGELNGAVAFVDTRSRVIGLTRGGYSGREERVYYDERTAVEYRGQFYRPDELERGDVLRIQARPRGNDWVAERIWVEVNVRDRRR
ncbi:DUF5666 domain-containing protein [Lysobacter sp. A3-1-A15]|uniref:DUF5666 domain-containing protein n=1 Tax=Novilysobacter viscosus TaxID=3098602 RepID=UPI002ED82037